MTEILGTSVGIVRITRLGLTWLRNLLSLRMVNYVMNAKQRREMGNASRPIMRYEQRHDNQTMVLSDKIQSGEWYVWLESESGESSDSLLLGVCEFEIAKERAKNWIANTGHVCGEKCGEWQTVP